MEEFYQQLKSIEDMSDSQIGKVKEIFGSQGISFKQLMKKCDLALTYAGLEKYGMTQGGLRTEILAVIKSNQ